MPQVIVVVEILVAQRQCVDPLGNEMLQGVLDELGVSMIGEASSKLVDDGREFLGLAEQQATSIGGDITAIERCANLARAKDREIQIGRAGVAERNHTGTRRPST